MSDFNLSDKRLEIIGRMDKKYYQYEEEDVKEFIKQLKEIVADEDNLRFEIIEKINKLAGDKLI